MNIRYALLSLLIAFCGALVMYPMNRQRSYNDLPRLKLIRVSSYLDSVLPVGCNPDEVKQLNDIKSLLTLTRQVFNENVNRKRTNQARLILLKLIERRFQAKKECARNQRLMKMYKDELVNLKDEIKFLKNQLPMYDTVIKNESNKLNNLQNKLPKNELHGLPDLIRESVINQMNWDGQEEKQVNELLVNLRDIRDITKKRYKEKCLLQKSCTDASIRCMELYEEGMVYIVQFSEAIVRIGKKFEGSTSPHIIIMCMSEYYRLTRNKNYDYERLSEEPIIGDDED